MAYIGTNKIGRVLFGSSAIGKVYIGTSLVYQSGLPTGYTQVQYVSTDSSAYVDTGIAGGSDLEITTVFSCHNYVQYSAVYGNYVDGSHKNNRVMLNSQTQLSVSGGNNQGQAVNGFSMNQKHTLIVNSTEAYLNGTRTAISSSSQTANDNKICLGNRSLTNPVARDLGLRIYSFKVKKNGTLVLNYVPCVRDSDSIAGFYDMVSGEFIRSDTSTDFSAPSNS